MNNLSRADLLRSLAKIEHDKSPSIPKLLAENLGFGYKEKQDNSQEQSQNGDLSGDEESPKKQLGLPQIIVTNHYWYLNSREKLPEKKEEIKQQPLNIKLLEKKKTSLIESLSLKSEGEWQNLFDASLKQAQKSKRTDIQKSIAHLSKSKPADSLPKQKRYSFNKPICIIMERTQMLRIAWGDMREIWQNIKRLVGEKNLKSYILPTGIEGEFQAIQGAPSFTQLEVGTRLIYIGTFGALHSGEVSESWKNHLYKCLLKGYDCQLYSLCPIINSPIDKVHFLDDRVQKADALDQLVQSMQLVWLIYDRQLRYLREATEGATLYTELLAFNHLNIEKDAQFIWHKHSEFKYHFTNIKAIQLIVEKATKRWSHGRSDIADEMEQLLGQMIGEKEFKLNEFPYLKNLAALSLKQQENGEKSNMGLTLLSSILPELEILAKGPAKDDFIDLLNAAQTEAKRRGYSLPLGDEGLKSTDPDYALITQQDSLLKLSSSGEKINPAQNLLSIGNQAYCEENNRVIVNTLPTQKSLNIKDQGQRYQLSSTRKPKWASRIWHNADGLHAAQEDGTEFHLTPATKSTESAQWQGTHNVWDWATDYGIDDYGLWAVLTVKNVDFKLRWIHAGTFMMGSPEGEKDREGGETQHQVTLTKGYWLAETSVTQVQWQAVMNENPSDSKVIKLPVSKVSWNDCQIFIEKLQKLVPDFNPSLPTEAQWEYACRAGTETAYWWGDKLDESKANNSSSLKAESKMDQNHFGLRSMSGNILEWCNDGWTGYSKQAVTDPKGDDSSSRRVLRGGSWIYHAQYLRSANRRAYQPGFRSRGIGMRLAGGLDPTSRQ